MFLVVLTDFGYSKLEIKCVLGIFKVDLFIINGGFQHV